VQLPRNFIEDFCNNTCMNKIFFITFVAISVLLSFNATAQEKKEQRHFDREAFEARRNAFITAEVGLTPEEAAQFIPLCNELRQKKFEVGRECRKLSKEIRRYKCNEKYFIHTSIITKIFDKITILNFIQNRKVPHLRDNWRTELPNTPNTPHLLPLQ